MRDKMERDRMKENEEDNTSFIAELFVENVFANE